MYNQHFVITYQLSFKRNLVVLLGEKILYLAIFLKSKKKQDNIIYLKSVVYFNSS